jgi:RNA polymerase sigma-70 factor, ECF subfamily
MIDWSQIVNQHGPMVYRTAFRLLNHDADAADCFQRTFVSALELSRTDIIHNWAALLKRLAVARALERMRQRTRETSRSRSLPFPGEPDPRAVEPVHAAQANELTEALRGALAELEFKQAKVFCLACLEEMSYQEIADQLRITVNHVGVLLSRAKTSLRERLHMHGPMPEAGPVQREVEP